MTRRLVLIGMAVLLAGTTTGCSNPGTTTCAEYGVLSYPERDDVLKDLLVSHRLEPNHLGNSLGVSQSVDTFCGTFTNQLMGDRPATQNLNRPIDEAVDWDSDTW